MLYVGSFLKAVDNSGARLVKCLKILGKSFKGRAKVGDIVVVSVKKALPNKRVKKGELYKAVVVCTKFRIYRFGGFYIFFSRNAVVLLNNKTSILGTRVLSPVSKELRNKNFLKIVSLAPSVF